jgi:hypothetical protein
MVHGRQRCALGSANLSVAQFASKVANRPSPRFTWMGSRLTGKVPAVLTFSTAALRPAISLADFFSAVRTARPATRSAHSFLKFRAYSLNVLSSRFRFLDGDNPADPLIAREWRNVLPFCPCNGIGNENLSQIRRYIVYRARRERFPVHGFHSTSLLNQSGESTDAVRIGPPSKANFKKVRIGPISHER